MRTVKTSKAKVATAKITTKTSKNTKTSKVSNEFLKGKRENDYFNNVYNFIQYYVGGLENILMDYDEESTEYQNAISELSDKHAIVELAEKESTKGIYVEGGEKFDDLSVMRARAFFMVKRKRRFEIVRYAMSKIEFQSKRRGANSPLKLN